MSDRESLSNLQPVFPRELVQGKARDALCADRQNYQLPRTTIRLWSGFSGCQWLCCSTFAQNCSCFRAKSAHPSEKLPIPSSLDTVAG